MSKLENTLISINSLARPATDRTDAVAMLAVTLLYLVAVLSVPLYAPQRIIWLAVYPVVQSEVSGIGFLRVFLRSLWVLPLILLIGVFNPVLDTQTAFMVGDVAVSRGWVSLISIVLRGLLAMQAALLLAMSAGFYDMCGALRRFGCPRVLVTQLQFTYRYMAVITEEALWMDRTRKARGFGRRNYPLRMWGRMVGQLLVRSYERAARVHRAMLSRGFDGSMPLSRRSRMTCRSWCFIAAWAAVVLLLRFADISSLLIKLKGI